MEENKTLSFRINFEQEDVDFMKDYKEEYGASIQWFVEKAVKERIRDIKIKQELGEL